MSNISRDDWLKALTEVSTLPADDNPDAVTSAEFATMCGFSQDTARRRLQTLLKLNRVQQTSKWIHDMSGRPQHVRAYKLLEKPEKL